MNIGRLLTRFLNWLANLPLRLVGIEHQVNPTREQRVKSMARLFRKAKRSIKIVCDPDEIPEIVEAFKEAFPHG